MPHINFEVGSIFQAIQMERFEAVCLQENQITSWLRDVNSTAACALIAAKLGFKIMHYEAGFSICDRSMHGEIKRLITDVITDYYY